MTALFDSGVERELTKDELNFAAGALIEAGSDTTRASLNQIVAAACQQPDWVARVQKQLDVVCGISPSRLPDFDDMPSLPLVKAVVKESLRWK